MKEIAASGKYGKGKVILIDDEDYEKLNIYKWYLNKKGYAIRNKYLGTVNGKRKNTRPYLHREIMDCPKDKDVDHINHNPLDNRKINLRICTHKNNQGNQIVHKVDKTSKYKGVSKCTNNKECTYWRVKIGGVRIGYFPFTDEGEIQAARAYDKAALLEYGEFACTNKMLGLL